SASSLARLQSTKSKDRKNHPPRTRNRARAAPYWRFPKNEVCVRSGLKSLGRKISNLDLKRHVFVHITSQNYPSKTLDVIRLRDDAVLSIDLVVTVILPAIRWTLPKHFDGETRLR
ncbi:hypothetical protein HW555_013840, partial [Spodoptera exigua]